MYHRLNKFDCLPLKKLNEIARLTLSFALDQEDHREPSQIKPDFEAHFADQGLPGVGKWLWGKPLVIREPLLRILEISLAKKQQLRNVLAADMRFDENSCSGHLLTTTLDQNDEAVKSAKSMMIGFYEAILREGVPAALVGELDDFDRQVFLGLFLKAHAIKACPGCDGQPPSIDLYADKVREDVDHFLPKSKYPILAVHPLNLVPLCKTCNQDYKKEKDALSDEADAPKDVTCLEHMFHPYLRPACDEVYVTVAWRSTDSRLTLHIEPRNDTPTAWARVHSLEYILALESRWNGDLDAGRLEEPIKSCLRYSTQLERLNIRLNEADLDRHYDTICKTFEDDIGLIPGRVAAKAFVSWLVTDTSAKETRTRIAMQVFDAVQHKCKFSPREGLTPPMLI